VRGDARGEAAPHFGEISGVWGFVQTYPTTSRIVCAETIQFRRCNKPSNSSELETLRPSQYLIFHPAVGPRNRFDK
jgi:hypothetical protein